ncbi:MAG: thioredoxin domain-containing protein [Anaerolineae bacterium]|nr:thioredoxin domain-containing protein [Anaerolineae bacterium]
MDANTKNRNRMIVAIGIGVIAVIALAVIILTSTAPVEATSKFAELPQSRRSDGGFVVGNPEAPITLVEFADYACSFCQQYEETVGQFVERYVKTGQAKYEFWIFPTAGGELTAFVGSALVCMEEQKSGAFWSMHDYLYQSATRGSYDGNTARQVAEQLGVDYGQALNCTAQQEYITNSVNLGREVGVSGTPAVRVRYGDGPAQVIVYQGQTYDRSGVPIDVLGAIVEAANQG